MYLHSFRFADIKEIGDMVVLMCSDRASTFMTGSDVILDGGKCNIVQPIVQSLYLTQLQDTPSSNMNPSPPVVTSQQWTMHLQLCSHAATTLANPLYNSFLTTSYVLPTPPSSTI